MFMLFLLRPPKNHAIVTSVSMHYIFCQGRELKHSVESVLPVMKKEGKGKGKWTIGPRMKIFLFPSPLFLSQVGHSRLSVLPLSLDQKYSACIVTSQ